MLILLWFAGSVNVYFATFRCFCTGRMFLTHLREQVLDANLELVRRGLVLYTFGNASAISRQDGLVVIKPSGIPYESMKPADLANSLAERIREWKVTTRRRSWFRIARSSPSWLASVRASVTVSPSAVTNAARSAIAR